MTVWWNTAAAQARLALGPSLGLPQAAGSLPQPIRLADLRSLLARRRAATRRRRPARLRHQPLPQHCSPSAPATIKVAASPAPLAPPPQSPPVDASSSHYPLTARAPPNFQVALLASGLWTMGARPADDEESGDSKLQPTWGSSGVPLLGPSTRRRQPLPPSAAREDR